MWAFFKRFDFVDSNKVVTTKKKAHTPICGLDKLRISIRKLIKPNNVSEKRWRKVKKAERIQYDDKYFFNGVYIGFKGSFKHTEKCFILLFISYYRFYILKTISKYVTK
jgi:hypothetical protein